MLQFATIIINAKFGAFREITISRARSGGRREVELNSGSLPPIPGGLATLVTARSTARSTTINFIMSLQMIDHEKVVEIKRKH